MANNRLNRRMFLKTSVLGTTGALLANKVTASRTSPSFDPEELKAGIVKRALGNTGLKLPVVNFGVMRADNPNLVKAAMEAGMEHFDTAHVYQNGNNEKMLGEVFKDYPRDAFTIASKIKPEEKDRKTGHLLPGSTKKAFLQRLDTSLKKLKMDHVDILYSHVISSRQAVFFEPIVDALLTAKKQGKTRFIGVSTHKNEPEVIRAAIEAGVHDVVLTAYNFKQDHRKDLTRAIQEASEAGIGIVAMKTMAGGKFGELSDKAMPYQAALKWALRTPHVHTSIPGITSFQELKENMAIMADLKLSDEEQKFLYAASFEQGLYCNGCDRCTDTCPRDIPIPDMMRAYMYAYGYGETAKAKQELTELGIGENPCRDCDICTAACPKNFDIPGKLSDIARITQVPDDFLV